jgi:hypothetical protein
MPTAKAKSLASVLRIARKDAFALATSEPLEASEESCGLSS